MAAAIAAWSAPPKTSSAGRCSSGRSSASTRVTSSARNRWLKPSAATVTSIRSRSAWITGKVPPPLSSLAVKNQLSTPEGGVVLSTWS